MGWFTNFLDKYFPLAPHPLKVLAERRKRRREQVLEHEARRIVALQGLKDGENICLARGSFITEEDRAQSREELYSRSW